MLILNFCDNPYSETIIYPIFALPIETLTMFSPIDIQQELVNAKQKHAEIQSALMREANAAIKQGKEVDEYIVNKLKSAPKPGKSNINPELLEKNRIFSIDDIKTVCINFRLRFLDSKYFKMEELPYDAVIAIKSLERHLGEEVKHIKIVGSKEFFKLEDRHKDPLIFARIDNDNYYLIHKWGNDFPWYKKIVNYPFRSVLSLLLTMVVIGIPLSFLIPVIIFHKPEEVRYYQNLYLAGCCIYTFFTMVFGGFTFYKHFSKVCWNSPYFN